VLSTVFWKLWKRVIFREADHCLSHVVVKERSCASALPISLYGMHRDNFNTIHIGIVTDSMHCEISEICCVAVGIAARLYCLTFGLVFVRNIDGEIDFFFLIGCTLGRDFPVL